MRRPWMLVACAIALSGLAGLGTGAAGAVTAAPTVSVPPNQHFTNEQSIRVTGAGLVPGEAVSLIEDCESFCVTTFGAPETVDATGHVSFTVTVQRFLRDLYAENTNPPTDCAFESACFVRLTRPDSTREEGYAVVASARLPFSAAPVHSPVASISAPQPLPAAVTTEVHGHGFTPGDDVYVARCWSHITTAGPAGGCRATDTSTVADALGDATLSVDLRQRTPLWDCLDPATTCAVRLWETHPFSPPPTVTLALSFDPRSVAPPAPTLTATPATGLGVADTVQVHGSGFRPGREIRIDECLAPGGTCALGTSFQPNDVLALSDSTGSFDVAMPTQRYVIRILEPAIDCAAVNTCALIASDDPDNPAAPLPLQFATLSDDPTITFDGAFVTEGTGPDATVAAAHVHLDRPATHPVRFLWFPESFADVHFSFDVVEIPAGATEATFPVPVVADSIHEPTEIVSLKILAMEGAQIDPRTPTVPIVIIDDDPRPTVTAADALVVENDPRGAVVRVQLSNPSATPLTISYRTVHHSARAGRDYEFQRGTITFSPGDVVRDIAIPLVDDQRHEPTEYFDVRLSDPHGGRIADRTARVWIGDDD